MLEWLQPSASGVFVGRRGFIQRGPLLPTSLEKAHLKDSSLNPTEVLQLIQKLQHTEYLIEDILPLKQIAIMAGDSGLGKTPLAIQMAVCVAAGIPFLGKKCKKGNVIYVDCENTPQSFYRIAKNISEALGLSEIPEGLRRLELPNDLQMLASMKEHKAKLLIIDTLRYIDKDAETESSKAMNRLGWFKSINALPDAPAVLFIHHLKKLNEEYKRPKLEDENIELLTWMQYTSGTLALINQSDARIGFDSTKGEGDVVIRSYCRGIEDMGPIYLKRKINLDGEVVAYEKVLHPRKIKPQHHEPFTQLPAGVFSFRDALEVVGKNPRFVSELLKDCMIAGLLTKTGEYKETRYEKL